MAWGSFSSSSGPAATFAVPAELPALPILPAGAADPVAVAASVETAGAGTGVGDGDAETGADEVDTASSFFPQATSKAVTPAVVISGSAGILWMSWRRVVMKYPLNVG